MKKITTLLLTTTLTIACNSFGMEKEAKQTITDYDSVPFDVVAGLEENNKLLRDIKRQNRAIIKQNYLNYEHQTLHTELCSSRTIAFSCSEKEKIEKKHKLASKMKEIYFIEKFTDRSWESSNEEK